MHHEFTPPPLPPSHARSWPIPRSKKPTVLSSTPLPQREGKVRLRDGRRPHDVSGDRRVAESNLSLSLSFFPSLSQLRSTDRVPPPIEFVNFLSLSLIPPWSNIAVKFSIAATFHQHGEVTRREEGRKKEHINIITRERERESIFSNKTLHNTRL